MGKLTIGTCVHDDFEGLYFTLQSIRLHHKDVLDRLEFVVINNNPKSPEGQEIRKLMDWIKQPLTYVEFDAFNLNMEDISNIYEIYNNLSINMYHYTLYILDIM